MTRLRKMMLEELQRRNYSENTTRYYIRAVEDFSRRFNRPPDRLGLRHIREYQAELFQKRKLSPGSINNNTATSRRSSAVTARFRVSWFLLGRTENVRRKTTPLMFSWFLVRNVHCLSTYLC